jgi:YidC/Oxa1 family membrane protein insertase
MEIITTPFLNVLLFIYTLVKDFGVAIILFTILIRLITHPLTVQQLKGSTAMQELNSNKEWQEIQKKYKDDREKLAQEQMRLYKELGINPFGSCLPTLIQFPIIIGLYQSITQALASSPLQLAYLERHIYGPLANVTQLIPLDSKFLWMDLAQPERLIIPGLGFGIPVLAIVVVITTYMQSKLMMPPTTGNDQGAAMGKAMNLYMPFLMGWMALTLASGLSLYFLVSNVIGINQYAALGKLNWSALLPGKKPVPATVTAGKPERISLPSIKLEKPEPVKVEQSRPEKEEKLSSPSVQAREAYEARLARRRKPIQQVKKVKKKS